MKRTLKKIYALKTGSPSPIKMNTSPLKSSPIKKDKKRQPLIVNKNNNQFQIITNYTTDHEDPEFDGLLKHSIKCIKCDLKVCDCMTYHNCTLELPPEMLNTANQSVIEELQLFALLHIPKILSEEAQSLFLSSPFLQRIFMQWMQESLKDNFFKDFK